MTHTARCYLPPPVTLPERVRLAVAADFAAKYVDRVTDEVIAYLSSGVGVPFVATWCRKRGLCS